MNSPSMKSTRRLDWESPETMSFEAGVTGAATFDGRPSIVLEASAFYPESGGQMGDHGTLVIGGETHAIVDVQIDDAGVVHHIVERPLVTDGSTTARGTIDRTRRRTFRSLHTAQHLLSHALDELAAAPTKSSRLGETVATIDVERDGIGESKIASAERWVNDVIADARAVRAWFPSDEELAGLVLRRAPKQRENVRVVDIGGLDVSPCGGTHVANSAEIALLRVLSTERYKGGTRISFSAGPRALRELHDESRLGRAIAAELGAELSKGVDGVKKLRLDLESARLEGGRLRSELARRLALVAPTDDTVKLVLDAPLASVELARAVAEALLTEPGRQVAVVAPLGAEGAHVVIARSEPATLDAGAALRTGLAAVGGKGGGRRERAEGRLPAGVDVTAWTRDLVLR